MQGFLEYIVKGLVNQPDAVTILPAERNGITVFELRPAMVTVSKPSAFALLPFALAEDAIANASMPIAVAGMVVATPTIAIFAGPHVAAFVIEQGVDAVGKVVGRVERSSP